MFAVLQQQKMAIFYIWVAALLAGALTVNGQGVFDVFQHVGLWYNLLMFCFVFDLNWQRPVVVVTRTGTLMSCRAIQRPAAGYFLTDFLRPQRIPTNSKLRANFNKHHSTQSETFSTSDPVISTWLYYCTIAANGSLPTVDLELKRPLSRWSKKPGINAPNVPGGMPRQPWMFRTRFDWSQSSRSSVGWLGIGLLYNNPFFPVLICHRTIAVCYCVDCRRWTFKANVHYPNGALRSSATSVGLCQTTCDLDARCLGFDWVATNSPDRRCWLTLSSSVQETPFQGVTHYFINRNCQGKLQHFDIFFVLIYM